MKPKILVVDDEKIIRDFISRHFRFLGYETITAASGKEALEILNTTRCDIVISDIAMPEMTGVEFLRRLKLRYPMTHVIMVTGYVTMENVLACMRHGADTCVFKPFKDIAELEKAVEDAVASIMKWQAILKNLKGLKDTEG